MSDIKDAIFGALKKILPYLLIPLIAAFTGITKPELLAKVNTALAGSGISVIATTDTIGRSTPQIEGGDVVPPEGGVTIVTADKDVPNITVKTDTPIEDIEPAAAE